MGRTAVRALPVCQSLSISLPVSLCKCMSVCLSEPGTMMVVLSVLLRLELGLGGGGGF